jgi:small subunit ribosomal protein S2
MDKPSYNQMLESGVHFGHLKKKWNPKMRPYIFKEHKGVHLIDLNRTSECLDKAASALKQIAKSGRKIMFVATKKQAREVITQLAQSVNMPYVTDRWLGGMMTNFATIRRSVKKMNNIERMLTDTTITNITKKERLTLSRERAKLDRVLSGIAAMNRLPSAIFVVDTIHEHLALKEAEKLGVRTFAMVDTNSDPNEVDFPIPSNDDSSKSIELIAAYLTNAIKEGLAERTDTSAEN